MKVSWQPSSNLKKCLIDEFEQGITLLMLCHPAMAVQHTLLLLAIRMMAHHLPKERNRALLLHHQIMGISYPK
jgi:hypothetical protein